MDASPAAKNSILRPRGAEPIPTTNPATACRAGDRRRDLPVMLAQGRGVVINISSLASIRHTGYLYSTYYAAEAGVNQLTVTLALEYARRGIGANANLPGLVETPLIDNQITG